MSQTRLQRRPSVPHTVLATQTLGDKDLPPSNQLVRAPLDRGIDDYGVDSPAANTMSEIATVKKEALDSATKKNAVVPVNSASTKRCVRYVVRP